MFPTGYQNAIGVVGSGEIHGGSHIIIDTANFEDELVIGRFAKIDTTRLDNLDNSSTPQLAGVVMRKVDYALDMVANAIDKDLYPLASYVTQGLVSVDAISGETPVIGAFVYAVNASGSGANFGKATTTTTNNVVTNAKFVEKISDTVWLVQLV